MQLLNFPMIVLLELRNYIQSGARKQWAILFSIFIQLVSIGSFTIGMKLGNFITDIEILNVLSHFTLLIYIYCIPAFVIILCYDSFIRDPSLQITAVVIIDRYKLFFTKLLSISLFSFIFFLVNSTISFLILLILLGEVMALYIFLKSIIIFLIICLFFTQMTIFLVLLIRKFTLDDITTLIIPIIIFYILPLLIHSTINLQILNSGTLLISPGVWAIFFLDIIYGGQIELNSLILPFTLILLIYPNLWLIKNHEFR